MKIGDIVIFYHYDYGVPEITVGYVILASLSEASGAEWFDVAYEGMGKTLYAGLYEEDAISCLGPDTIDEMVMM